jgi:predicted Zn-dependent protease
MLLKLAEKNMPDNYDLKMKLSQILYQENINDLQYIEKAIHLKPNDPDILMLYAKMLLREKDAAMAENSLELALRVFKDKGEKPRADLYFLYG